MSYRGPRRTNYGSKSYKRTPYQTNTMVFNGSAVNLSTQLTEYFADNTAGTGKTTVARPTINISVQAASATPVYWAIVFVPEGYAANTLALNSGDALYEPNQYVMASGCFVADADSEPFRLASRLKRKLNLGDRIALLMRAGATTGINYAATINYWTKNN